MKSYKGPNMFKFLVLILFFLFSSATSLFFAVVCTSLVTKILFCILTISFANLIPLLALLKLETTLTNQ